MAEKEPEIKISDRRRFTSEGEARPEASPTPVEPQAEQAPVAPPEAPAPQPPAPPPPSAEEQEASREAFSSAGAHLDEEMKSAFGARYQREKLEASFETFVASLYMSAMLQLGLLREQGQQPQLDLVGARHTIDTLAMLEEKTRGNLTAQEKAVLDDVLFRLRMAFVEVTNVLTRGVPDAPPGGGEPR